MYPLERKEDVVLRLNNCACMYKGSAYIIAVNTNMDLNTVQLRSMRGGGNSAPITISAQDPDFFVSRYRLGYLNTQGFSKKSLLDRTPSAVYVSRMPVRMQQQGLSLPQLRHVNPGALHETYYALRFNAVFADMLENIYPTCRHAIEVMERSRDMGMRSMAFHRDWCLFAGDMHTMQLYYRNGYVAGYDRTAGAFIVDTSVGGVSFLLDNMRDVGIPVKLREDV